MNIELRISALLTVVTLICGQNIEKNATSNVTESTAQNNTSPTVPTPTPLEIVCNHIETCQQNDTINVQKYKDLRTRKCMCDEKCSTYGDCCKDSKYYNMPAQLKRSFTCVKTLLDGSIYMINKCAPGYANPTMIKYCENPSPVDLVENYLTGIAVAVVEKSITYKNAYCAICNYDTEFEFWNPKLYFKLAEPDIDIVLKNTSKPFSPDKNSYSVAIHSPEQVLSNMTMTENHTQLISVVNETLYFCYVVPKLLGNQIPAIRYCRHPDSNIRSCSDCERNNCVAKSNVNTKNTLTLSWEDPKLPIVYTCDDVPDDVYERQKFCEANIDHCFIRNDAKELCLVNSHFEPHEYKLNEDDSIYIEKYHATFPPWDYLNTTAPGVIYICGPTIPMSGEDESFTKLRVILTKILTKLSIFFLIIYLVINVNTKKLQSLPNKILFSFCFTLLLLYVAYEVSLLVENCSIASAVIHYLTLSCITWLLIASCDFWQVICLSSTKLQTLAGKTRLKRYLLYCFFGWISPCFIMAVAIYFELALNRIIPCYLKPGYGRLKQCFISQADPKLYFFIYPITAAFCIILALFAHTSYHIYLSKRKNIKSTAQNNYYSLFLKLALSMGVTWTVALLVTYVNSNIINTVFVILMSSHGIFIFFAYGFKRTMLTKMYETQKNISIVQQTRSTFLSFADKIKNPTSQSTASAESRL
ncbi:uncharacterized protein LOC135841394 isoform X2 [Planococcus citri]|uniref:uncharacterized protein LOC135841394 isoform X2 n=1 Tax=Planococcus citri TaxID=170843 RepID=UPI0031F87689